MASLTNLTILQGQVGREIAKKINTFAADQQLQGQSNYNLWLQGLNILFRAIGLPTFTEDPSVLRAYSDPD